MNRMKQIIGKLRGFFLENITRWLIFGLLVSPDEPNLVLGVLRHDDLIAAYHSEFNRRKNM
ncbi:MAG: hypothetical protein QMD11_02920 [Smithella sp.]|nr:hypothetical protein [Smithella sp.]